MRIKLGRPSPALVISCIALFVALGGVGYAAATGSIDGREVKNNSIASKDIKNSSIVSGDVKNSTLTGSDLRDNGVKGSDVDESSLGRIPSAGRADSAGTAASATNATNAVNASTVGGMKFTRVNYLGTTADQALYDDGVIRITVSCFTGSPTDVDVTVRSLRENNGFYAVGVDLEALTDDKVQGFDQEGVDFDEGETNELTDTLGDETSDAGAGTDDPAKISFTAHSENHTRYIQGELITDESPCRVAGLVISN